MAGKVIKMKSIALVAVVHYALSVLCSRLFGVDGVQLAIEPMTALALGSLAMGGAQMGMSLFGGGGRDAPDISGEMARINALYDQARTHGTAAITQDFQAQRGELAQSQAARGILRSGVSQLGLARLGAARQQALAQFNAQLYGQQAGQQSSLLNALMGRSEARADAQYAQKQQGISQGLGMMGGALGAWGAQYKPSSQGANYAGGGFVDPRLTLPGAQSQYYTPQPFIVRENTTLGTGGGTTFSTPGAWR